MNLNRFFFILFTPFAPESVSLLVAGTFLNDAFLLAKSNRDDLIHSIVFFEKLLSGLILYLNTVDPSTKSYTVVWILSLIDVVIGFDKFLNLNLKAKKRVWVSFRIMIDIYFFNCEFNKLYHLYSLSIAQVVLWSLVMFCKYILASLDVYLVLTH